MALVGIPIGLLFDGNKLDARDFLGMPSTPSGGIYALAILFSYLMAKLTGSRSWIFIAPLFFVPFLVSESFRFILHIIIFILALTFLRKKVLGITIFALIVVFLITYIGEVSESELFKGNWRIEGYIDGLLLLFELDKNSLSDLDSRNGIILRLALIYHSFGYLTQPQAILGWGPNSSYELLEQSGGRHIYSHNSLIEFVLSYGYIGALIFTFTFIFLQKRSLNNANRYLFIALLISSLSLVFFNGKMYMLNSFWLAYFVIKVFGRHQKIG
jgi:hypothetical protein